jgi:hypothetical protein
MSTMSAAIRRYLVRLAALMSIYMVCIFTAGYVFRHYPPSGVGAVALALLPALPIIGVVWVILRLIVEESDEYLRLLHVKMNLMATGFCLTVMTAWEFLQNYDVVSDETGGFGATFVWFVGLGLAGVYVRLVDGKGDCA